jgi:hypothetical protein
MNMIREFYNDHHTIDFIDLELGLEQRLQEEIADLEEIIIT